MTGQSQGQALMHNQDKPMAAVLAEQAMVDPVMREAMKQQAVYVGGHVAVAAKHYGHKGLMAFQDYVQQGPQGISMLCFVGGVATTALGIAGVSNLMGSVMDPFHYILNVYILAFGIATTCIEADTDQIGMMIPPFDRLAEPITRGQAWLHEECKLLTRLRGRGFFYLYQGTLMVTQCVFCMLFLGGLYNVLMGIVCIMVSCGMQPDFEGMAAQAGLGPQYTVVAADSSEEKPASAEAAARREKEASFRRAEGAWEENRDRLPGKACRELWAFHQQATIGDCNVPKPSGVFNGNAKEQWRLWNGLKGISQEDAMVMFMERLSKANIPT